MEYTKRALLVIDVQNDFCEHGAIPSLLGSQLASLISVFAQTNYDKYELLLASKDSHKSPKGHFSSSPDFLYSWPSQQDGPSIEVVNRWCLEGTTVKIRVSEGGGSLIMLEPETNITVSVGLIPTNI